MRFDSLPAFSQFVCKNKYQPEAEQILCMLIETLKKLMVGEAAEVEGIKQGEVALSASCLNCMQGRSWLSLWPRNGRNFHQICFLRFRFSFLSHH